MIVIRLIALATNRKTRIVNIAYNLELHSLAIELDRSDFLPIQVS